MAYAKAGRYHEITFAGGTLAAGVVVTVRNPGTAVAATLWTSRNKTAAGANPVTVDASGNLSFYADPGFYDLYANGTTIPNILVPVDYEAVDLAGTQTITAEKTFTHAAGLRWVAEIVDGTSGAAPGVWDLTTEDTTGYVIHLNVHNGAQGVGIGVNDGVGIVVNSYEDTSRGILLTLQPDMVNAAGVGFFGTTESTAGTLMKLEQNVAGAKEALRLVAQVNQPAQRLVSWAGPGWGGDNEGGHLDASTGKLVSLRGGIDVYNSYFVQVAAGRADELPYSTHGKFGVIGSDFGLTLRRWTGGAQFTTTLAASSAVGAATVSMTAAPTVGMTVLIEQGGANPEVRTVTLVTGSGPYTVTLNQTLSIAHASGVNVYVGQFWTSQIKTLDNGILIQQSSGPTWAGGETMQTAIAAWQGLSVGLCGFGALAASDFAGGYGLVGIKNTSFPPSTNPVGGGLLYVESGALKYKGSSGTVTTLAVA